MIGVRVVVERLPDIEVEEGTMENRRLCLTQVVDNFGDLVLWLAMYAKENGDDWIAIEVENDVDRDWATAGGTPVPGGDLLRPRQITSGDLVGLSDEPLD